MTFSGIGKGRFLRDGVVNIKEGGRGQRVTIFLTKNLSLSLELINKPSWPVCKPKSSMVLAS